MHTRTEVNRHTTGSEPVEAAPAEQPIVRGEQPAASRRDLQPTVTDRVSVDPMRSTDRYRLVRPGDDRFAR